MFFKKPPALDSAEKIELIEQKVFSDLMKNEGFRKAGHVLFRLVDIDMFHIVTFQKGISEKKQHDCLWVNIGIRIPEAFEHKFVLSEPVEKFYHEYQCNFKTRLSVFTSKKDIPYDLEDKKTLKIAEDIIANLKKYVLPMFLELYDREKFLLNRCKYESIEQHANLAALEAAMIYGRKGDREGAASYYKQYYTECLEKREQQRESPEGEKALGETVPSGFEAHIEYLRELARELGIAEL